MNQILMRADSPAVSLGFIEKKPEVLDLTLAPDV